MSEISVPDDFPRAGRSGAVSGAQTKFLARLIDGKFITGLTDEELRERYVACEDLVQQLARYAAQKLADNPSAPADEVLDRVKAGVRRKVRLGTWTLSSAEIDWIMNRVRRMLSDRNAL